MSGGGGGQSGTVQFPAHIAAVQLAWIDDDPGYAAPTPASAVLNTNLVEAMDAAMGSSPFIGETAYDSATRISNWLAEVGAYETIVDALDQTTDWAAAFAQAVTTVDANWTAPTPAASAEITAAVTAFEAIQDDRVEETVLPRFQRGMQDIGGVLTSAFVIGQAIIEGMTDRDVAQYQGELRTKAYLLKDQLVADSLLKKNIAYTIGVEQMIKYVGLLLASNEALARITLQSEGMALEAERTEEEDQRDIDEADARWDLSMFAYGGNFIAAGSGGTYVPPAKTGPSRTQAMIGGAASGAAMGGQVGGGWGAGIGAVVGAYMGYAST